MKSPSKRRVKSDGFCEKKYFQRASAAMFEVSKMRGPLRMRMRQLGVARVVVLLTSFLSAGPRFDRIALGVCGAC